MKMEWKRKRKLRPGEEIVNGFLIQRTSMKRWPENDPDGRKGFIWRHTSWACYDEDELICVCTCRRGARAVAEYLARKGIFGNLTEQKENGNAS